MPLPLRLLLLIGLVCCSAHLPAQRSYAAQSVLANGNWYQVGTTAPGIYRIDGNALQAMGFTLPLPASQLRLYGRHPGKLAEAAGGPYSDDLTELAIWVEDGGDGQVQASDYLLFYAAGPHNWVPLPNSRGFRHELNIYSDTAFYYLTSGGTGLRLPTGALPGPPTHTISTFQYRYWQENDQFNLLSGGQEWYGHRFLAEAPQPLRFTLRLPAPVPDRLARFSSTVAARSVGATAGFEFLVNGAVAESHTIAPVTASSFDLFARESSKEASFQPASELDLNIRFASTNSSAIGWMNRFQVLADCRLQWAGEAFDFRSWQEAGPGKIARYQLSDASPTLEVWKISAPLSPVRMITSFSGNQLEFIDRQEQPEDYFVFNKAAGFPTPFLLKRIPTQNLHGVATPELLIIAAAGLEQPAQRLANWHSSEDGLQCLVVPVEKIYHEFSAGIPDPAAIRDFVKLLHDRGTGNKQPAYLLLLGDASFDPKNRTTGSQPGIPSYQSSSSLDPLSTWVSDDFFGFLDDAEDINGGPQTNLLDISIGRIPVNTPIAANDYIDKLIAYKNPSTRGAWRNELTFIADDEDNNLHLQDMEGITQLAATTNDRFLHQKIYLDAYQQESSAAGSRYPQVNQAISDQMQTGTLIWNYTGHGGFRRLADEVILEQPIVDGWQQNGRLPLFVTATCDFAPFDNPTIQSLGEYLLIKPRAGAIALMTTTRLVFAYSNRIMNANYMQAALERRPDGRYRTLGEAAREAKNRTYSSSGDIFNNLKFTLLGDPALRLAFPEHQVLTTHINDRQVTGAVEPLKALEKVTVRGQVADYRGQLLTGFNGTVFPVVLDQPYDRLTLGNDPGSQATRFSVQDRALFRGRASVKEGKFEFSFFIPRDINYQEGNIRIQYYAMDSLSDAQGGFSELKISGSAPPPTDTEGPRIRAWLNDTLFRSGDLVQDQPVLLLRLADTSGINVMGSGFGHDITLVLDGAVNEPLRLNPFFEADADTYQSGSLRFQLPRLPDGLHTLQIKAWDQLNNSAETTLQFRVRSEKQLVVESLGVWPNPSAGAVRFVFAHNQYQVPMEASIELFSLQGQRIKIINGTIIANGNRSYLDWDGRNEKGFPVAPGVYFYRLVLRLRNGQTAVHSRQLIRL
ncbi:type IX secretion system sortase PorU [Flavihumibacter sp. CACIAM 22H1]|uniref:type IX secretion system sortase PorU n=1 Tax=Flavihumibacter sp. CACIAM 22H1 TaxID=1812911 RepID=UPI0007A80FCF|nr:type IX secretion system sortase PorU [Flavihumibacter sp. CACIAM 22H1]KYP16569.1 MAG: hypothetical protein A1D16_09105 [Flavihumibacter sp. CACIAM 22H1]